MEGFEKGADPGVKGCHSPSVCAQQSHYDGVEDRTFGCPAEYQSLRGAVGYRGAPRGFREEFCASAYAHLPRRAEQDGTADLSAVLESGRSVLSDPVVQISVGARDEFTRSCGQHTCRHQQY